MEYRLTTPCTAQDLAPLRAGDTVLLSGVVYTARDQAHKRMIEALDRGEPLPFDLEGSAIYYVGPTPERPGEVIGSAGPTTSGRMDAMSPRLLDLGNKIMIGKGKRDAAVKEAVVRNGAVYLAALGGAGALMAKSVHVQKNIKAIREGLKLGKDGIILPFSAETKQGREEIWALIDELTGLVPAATEEVEN